MNLLDFVAKYINTMVTNPGGLGGQCVDLANQYLNLVLRLNSIRANAVDWAGQRSNDFNWVANDAYNYPDSGDLIVWHPSVGGGIGTFGHIAVVLLADSLHFISFDQNWDGIQVAKIIFHTYDGVSGWQHPV